MTDERIAPRSILYSIAAGIGGTGLDMVAHETLLVAKEDGNLGKAIAFSNRQSDVPASRIRTLRWHPVKLLSKLPREYYMGARKHALDRAAARELAAGGYDMVHTWSGDCLRTLETASRRGVPSVIEIPTWHRNKGKVKKDLTWSEVQRDAARFPQSALNRLLVTRQQVMREYELATLILVQSDKSRETFLAAGIADEKVFLTSRGVDPDKFSPAAALPERFRVVFVGSLTRRKGVHHLLAAWKKLALPGAELVLVGSPTRELAAELRDLPASVQVRGHVSDVPAELRSASVHVFPSECEGSAKVTYEASSCGLPQITTRESGNVVVHESTGLIVPANDPAALAEAIAHLHAHPELCAAYGRAARERILATSTWQHYRERVREAYARAIALVGRGPVIP